MSYTDTRADRPITRRRYPSNSNNNSTADATNNNNNRSSSGALIPIAQQYPTTTTNNSSAEMDRYMAYMDLGQLLEHNMDALFPAADELLANHEAVAGENSTAYRNYLMEIEDASSGLIRGANGTQIFAQMPSIDMRTHHRSSRGNSRILRNFVLMDGRNNNEASVNSTRKPSAYHNNFPIFDNTEDAFLCNFETKSSTDPFTSTTLNQCVLEDQVHLNPRWQATVPCKYKLDEVFEEYNAKDAKEEWDEDQRNFAKELFFAAMFYEDVDGIKPEKRENDKNDGVKKAMLRPHKKYW